MRQGVGQHGAVGQAVQQVAPTLAAAQFVAGAAGVEQQAVGQGVGQLQHLLGRGVDHEQALALAVQGAGLVQQLVGGGGLDRGEFIAVLEEAPGAVAVGYGQLGAAPAGVLRLGNDIGQQRAACGLPGQIADAYLESAFGRADLGGEQGGAGQGQQVDQAVEQVVAHGAAPSKMEPA
ncbi:hypothetical protein FQZ97_643500 [compost metagenome]